MVVIVGPVLRDGGCDLININGCCCFSRTNCIANATVIRLPRATAANEPIGARRTHSLQLRKPRDAPHTPTRKSGACNSRKMR